VDDAPVGSDVAYARNGKVSIAYEVIGAGPMDLVHLPGFINNLEVMWSNPLRGRFLDRLSSFCRLIVDRPPGRGPVRPFDGPARGVRCETSIVDAVREQGIGIRAGLHTGEVEFDHDDVSEIGVAIGARVGAKAGPSEVLVSRTVRDLGSGLLFEDARKHELKGFPERWHLYRVTH
jgi:hypothetical protein